MPNKDSFKFKRLTIGLCFIFVLLYFLFKANSYDAYPPRLSHKTCNSTIERIIDVESMHHRIKSQLSSLNQTFIGAKTRDLIGNIYSGVVIADADNIYPIANGFIDPRKFRYRINTLSDVCRRSRFSLFVYVHSKISNALRRTALRATWANKMLLKKLNVGLVFIVGVMSNDTRAMKNLREESARHDDIVQNDYEDTYRNISVKSTSALNWAATYCAPYVPLLLKTDDDIYVNIARVVKYATYDLPKILSAYGDKLILCNLWRNESVMRDPNGRWYIPTEMYDKKVYPPFCQGSALLITSPAAVALRQALIGARLYPLDDVLLTGFTAPVAGVTLVAINSRHLSSLKKRNITDKDLRSEFLFVHSSIPNIYRMWRLTNITQQP